MGRTVIGIDLGTSSCSVACMIDGKPQVLPVFAGRDEMPTYVAFTPDGERLVGWPAKRQAVTNPANTIFAIKRLIGRRFASEATQAELGLLPYRVVPSAAGAMWVEAGGRSYSPTEIAAIMLAEVRRATEAYLGCPVREAVITVPAYFDEEQKQATRDAAKIAGLFAVRLIAEPTAAALAHGCGTGYGGDVAVYDLGGGTFDISILEMGDGAFEVKAVSGDNRLGGEDFDHCLVRYFVEQLKRDHGVDLSADSLALHRLKDAAEQLKIRLDAERHADVLLPYLTVRNGQPFHAALELSRNTLDQLFADLVERTIGPCRQALRDIALQDAERKKTNPEYPSTRLNALVLVGGMSRVPSIRKRVSDFFGLKPEWHHDPSRIVALGAAIQAGVLAGSVKNVLLLDVIPMSLGFSDAGGVFLRVIDRNTTIPTRKSRVMPCEDFGRDRTDRLIKTGKLKIVQGESEYAKDNLLLAELPIDFAAPPSGEVSSLEITFDLDANAIFNVSLKDKRTGVERAHRIDYRTQERIGETDFSEDSLASARAQADELLNLLATTLRAHGQYIQSHILHSIERAGNELRRAMQSRDAKELNAALSAFCDATNMKRPRDKYNPEPPLVAVKATTSGRFIFISYARKDIAWLDRLRTHLVPLERHGKIEIWHDGKIDTGALWQTEIETALAKTSVAILLVSANFMASAFIYDHELPPILERSRAHGLSIFPVFIGHCFYQRDPVLSRLNAFNDPRLPLSAMPDAEVEGEFARLSSELWSRLDI